MLRELMPDEGEVRGLLALLLLTDARRATRAAADGRMLLLEEQDRSRWDRAAIDEGIGLLTERKQGRAGPARAPGLPRPGRFVLQAAIAAVHAEAPSYGETDWPQLLQLYGELLKAWPTPVVALNRAVVHAMVAGPEAGLADIEGVERDGRLAGYRYLPAAKADLLRRLGRHQDAARAYRDALDLTDNDAERAFLARRITEVSRPAYGG
jgi:RNA polymerase sigma-70 factor (ECF subfamily)